MKTIFNKDHTGFGILLGIISPVILFGILYLSIFLIVLISGINPFLRESTLALISIALNFVFVRYYFNNLHYHESGKGVLMITFVLIMLFFLLIRLWENFQLPGLKPL